MAKKKKKKHIHSSSTNNRAVWESKTSLDKTYTAIQKVLKAYGFDPDLLQSFTKRQRKFLMFLEAEAPRFKVEEGSHVPRHLVNFISENTHGFLRSFYFGDESIGLTYLELATYGLAFSSIILSAAESSSADTVFSPKQIEIIKSIASCFANDRVIQDLYLVVKCVHGLVTMLSKVNFRVYGFDWKIKRDFETGYVKSTIFISSEETPIIHFVHKQKERIAFCVRAGRLLRKPAKTATIDRRFIFPNKKVPRPFSLDIYIQSHALQRVKERADIFSGHMRNCYLMESLIYRHRIVNSVSGSPMLECSTQYEGDERIIRFGYFPFIIKDDKLIVMTFLPLTSPKTVEGAYLQEHFGLQTEDIKFLGMDRLSFFFTVDFEQIPLLKEALVATKIWEMITFVLDDPDIEFSIDQKKTMMVKKFFEQKINNESETFYPEIEE
ncbi:MAG: hypothetical protein LBE13_11630 [Bacteroidales bacterium]|jgi:hypothetical protein|nr:hypothetical protein [Bacteroidales bacterium]